MATIEEVYSAQMTPSAAPAAAPTPTPAEAAAAAVAAAPPAETPAAAPEAVEGNAPAPAVEAPVEAAAPVKQEGFAKRFALAAQKEKELRQRELAVQARETAAKRAPEAPAQRAANPLDGLDLKNQPLTALHKLGISLQDIQEAVLRGEKQPEVDPMAARFKPLEDAAAELRQLKAEMAQRDADAAQKTYEGQVSGVKNEIVKMAENGYDMINSMGEYGTNTVFETMQLYYQQYDKVLTYKEACDIVESHFEEEFLPKLTKSNKVKARFTSAAAPAAEQPKKDTPKTAPKTLTNAQTAMPGAQPDFGKMSRDDQINWLASNVMSKTN